MAVTELVVLNPFRVVGIYVDDAQKVMDDNVAELLPMVRKGLSFPFPSDHLMQLGPLVRTEKMVTEAVRKLNATDERVLASFFWLRRNPAPGSAECFVNEAVECLMDGDPYQALSHYNAAFHLQKPDTPIRRKLYEALAGVLIEAGDTDPRSKLLYAFGSEDSKLIPQNPKTKPKPKPKKAPVPLPPAGDDALSWVAMVVWLTFVMVAGFFLCLSVAHGLPLFGAVTLIFIMQGFAAGRYMGRAGLQVNAPMTQNNVDLFSAALPFLSAFLLTDIMLLLLNFQAVRYFTYEFYWRDYDFRDYDASIGETALSVVFPLLGVLMLTVVPPTELRTFRQRGVQLNYRLLSISTAIVVLAMAVFAAAR